MRGGDGAVRRVIRDDQFCRLLYMVELKTSPSTRVAHRSDVRAWGGIGGIIANFLYACGIGPRLRHFNLRPGLMIYTFLVFPHSGGGILRCPRRLKSKASRETSRG